MWTNNRKNAILLCLVTVWCTLSNAHIPVVEPASFYCNERLIRDVDKFSLLHPLDYDTLPGTKGLNSYVDARAVTKKFQKDDVAAIHFTVNANDTLPIANAFAWVPACEQYEHIYVHAALVGPSSDPRFQPITAQQKQDYNIKWNLPAGSGAILAINNPLPRQEQRVTINITMPLGELWGKYFIQDDECLRDANCLAFRAFYGNDMSLGKMGCAFPEERCPGAPYPVCTGCPVCPHYMVGRNASFCPNTTERPYINERNLTPGSYYYVFWESNGRPVDGVVLMTGYVEDFKYGKMPDGTSCGSKTSVNLPPGCTANYPLLFARVGIFWDIATNAKLIHDRCDFVDY